MVVTDKANALVETLKSKSSEKRKLMGGYVQNLFEGKDSQSQKVKVLERVWVEYNYRGEIAEGKNYSLVEIDKKLVEGLLVDKEGNPLDKEELSKKFLSVKNVKELNELFKNGIGSEKFVGEYVKVSNQIQKRDEGYFSKLKLFELLYNTRNPEGYDTGLPLYMREKEFDNPLLKVMRLLNMGDLIHINSTRELVKTIKKYAEKNGGVNVGIMDKNGFPIVETVGKMDEDEVGADGINVLNVANKIAAKLGLGEVSNSGSSGTSRVTGRDRDVFVMEVAPGIYLTLSNSRLRHYHMDDANEAFRVPEVEGSSEISGVLSPNSPIARVLKELGTDSGIQFVKDGTKIYFGLDGNSDLTYMIRGKLTEKLAGNMLFESLEDGLPALETAVENYSELLGAPVAVVSKDALPITSWGLNGIDEEQLASVTSSFYDKAMQYHPETKIMKVGDQVIYGNEDKLVSIGDVANDQAGQIYTQVAGLPATATAHGPLVEQKMYEVKDGVPQGDGGALVAYNLIQLSRALGLGDSVELVTEEGFRHSYNVVEGNGSDMTIQYVKASMMS
jgi:predicted regulator of Ras-like GTPase activity (Roadblock/LC7/MglB family)